MNGIIAVDKPEGMTSHDVIDFIRKRFGIKKAGHAGTLDPAACGLLVVLLGRATKKSNQFINDDKEYDAVLKLGIRTETQDREGMIISENDCSHLTHEEIKSAFSRFEGTQEQIPPMFSAVKYKGRRLYELARTGRVVERTPRRVEIYKLEITYIKLPYVGFRVHCSKGTYIRQLCSDIGERLACGGSMHYLKRLRSGKFSIENAVTMEDLRRMDGKALAEHLL